MKPGELGFKGDAFETVWALVLCNDSALLLDRKEGKKEGKREFKDILLFKF